MKILVTGFDPFGGEALNPSWEAVKDLPDQIASATIYKRALPTVFGKAAEELKQFMIELQPDVVLNVGQAGGRSGITPERIAINLDDARIPDNEGNQPIDRPIQTEGAAAYFTQLPVKAIVSALTEAGLPSSVSNSAGTFVCNHVMYQALYLRDTEYPEVKGGFIHVPFIPEQVADRPEMPSLELKEITRGLQVAIETIVAFDGQQDQLSIGGSLH